MKPSTCIFVAWICAACASSEAREERPSLPFHIAIAPLSANDIRSDPKPGSEGNPTEMLLVPDARWMGAFSKGLGLALEQRAFARVTLLETGEAGGGSEDAGLGRDSALVRQARDQGADLLLCLELSIQPVIREEKNSTFWVNLPLFALGGPFGWWLADRTYYTDVEVSGWFYDPRSLASGPLDSPLRATRTEVASASRRTERMDLDFNERAQGSVGNYLLSFICPCGFLAGQSDELERELADRIVDQLGRGFARSVLDQSAVLERGAAPFFLDVAQSGLTRDRSGELVFKGTALLTPTREIESLGTWSVRVGSAPALLRTFDEGPAPESDGVYQRYRFEEHLGSAPDGAHVRLQLQAGERAPRVRSYTFRAPPLSTP